MPESDKMSQDFQNDNIADMAAAANSTLLDFFVQKRISFRAIETYLFKNACQLFGLRVL